MCRKICVYAPIYTYVHVYTDALSVLVCVCVCACLSIQRRTHNTSDFPISLALRKQLLAPWSRLLRMSWLLLFGMEGG